MPPLKRSPFNRAKRRGLELVNNAGDEAKVLLYDEVGFFGVTAKAFAEQLDKIQARTIHLHINSPGGDVFEGIAIATTIRNHSSRVVVHVDGIAASTASFIALAGDHIRMTDSAMFMIHEPMLFAFGNAAELRKSADLLDKVATDTIINEYMKRSTKPANEIRALMEAETWLSAKEAKELGFCDSIDHANAEEDDNEAVANLFDLSVFKNVPAALLTGADGEPTVRELEAALRDAGLSRAQARQMVSAGMKTMTQRDAEPDFTRLANSMQALKSTMSQ